MSNTSLFGKPVNRRAAIGTLAALGAMPLASRFRMNQAAAASSQIVASSSCVLSAAMTEGPYFVDERLNRSDLTSGSTAAGVTQGLPLTLRINLNSARGTACLPVSGVQVDVWHADAVGEYSDEAAAPGQPNTRGQTFLRGYQISDANGNVTFKTIYPGWYSGRTIHIHVKARLFDAAGNKTYEFTTQLFFDETVNDAVMATLPYNSRGTRDTRNANDNVYANQTSALVDLNRPSDGSAGYVATIAVGLDLPGSSSAIDLDQQGLTGLWYDPSTSGQGFALELFSDLIAAGTGMVQAGWFTFASGSAGGAESQRWYTVSGQMVTNAASGTLTIYQNVGGNFNAPPTTTVQAVGTATLSFTSCDRGQFTYAFSDGSGRKGIIPMVRLTPSVTCSATTARPSNADFALSGNWYNAATSGQGLIVELNPNVPYLFFAWYTYAPDGQQLGAAGQRWYTGQGAYQVGARSIAVPLFATTGGVFDVPTLPAPVTSSVGSATLAFRDCANANLTYAFTAGTNQGLSGMIALTRIGPTPVGCVA